MSSKKSEELYKGHEWRITLESAPLPDGRVKTAAIAHRPDSVHLLAFTDEGKLLLLREFRPFYGAYVWMLPSGRIDKESDRIVAAQRELQEETGFKAGELQYYFSARTSETLVFTTHVFIARHLTPSPLPQDEDELIEVHALSLDEAIEKIQGSKEVHTISALAVLRYMRDHK